MTGGSGAGTACGACILRGGASTPACLRCDTEQLIAATTVAERARRTSRRSRVIAIACLVVTAACWGSAFRFTEVALVELAPLELTFLRCLIGAIVICAAATVQQMSSTVRETAHLVSRREAWRALLIGGVCTGIAYVTVTVGQVGAASTTAGVVLGTVPVWTAMLALVLRRTDADRRRPPKRLLVALALGTAAAAIPAVADPARAATWAVALLFVAALAHAGSMVTIQPAVMRFGPLRSTAGVTILAALIVTPAWISGPTPSMPSATVIAAVLVLGVLPTGLAYVAFFEAVRRLGARTAALAIYLIPAVALTVGWLSDPRLVGAATLFGAACGIAAVALGVSAGARGAADAPQAPEATRRRHPGRPARPAAFMGVRAGDR